MPSIRLLGRRVAVPGHPVARAILGGAMVAGGMLGFLPVLGYWMVPVGLAILAVDFPPVRRFYRRATVRVGGVLNRRWPGLAARLGYGRPRASRHG